MLCCGWRSPLGGWTGPDRTGPDRLVHEERSNSHAHLPACTGSTGAGAVATALGHGVPSGRPAPVKAGTQRETPLQPTKAEHVPHTPRMLTSRSRPARGTLMIG